jgi:hypothetical protein
MAQFGFFMALIIALFKPNEESVDEDSSNSCNGV